MQMCAEVTCIICDGVDIITVHLYSIFYHV